MPTPTDIERENLEAHVELCAQRYSALEERMTKLETKVDVMHKDIIDGQKSLVKVIIGTAGTVIAGVISVVVAILLRAS